LHETTINAPAAVVGNVKLKKTIFDATCKIRITRTKKNIKILKGGSQDETKL